MHVPAHFPIVPRPALARSAATAQASCSGGLWILVQPPLVLHGSRTYKHAMYRSSMVAKHLNLSGKRVTPPLVAAVPNSILFLGRPGVGKTTVIREMARVLADELHKRVVIVDTSNEIGGDGDVPHPAIGGARRMQVPDPSQQHRVMVRPQLLPPSQSK